MKRVLTNILFALLLVQFVWATDYVDSFNGSSPWGSGQATSFTTGSLATGLMYTFTSDGDGGDFAWTSTGGNGNSGCVNMLSGSYNSGTTEKVTIVSRDGKAFVFDGIWFDIVGDGITVTGLGPEPFSFSGANGANTPSGGSKLVTEVQLTSTDFNTDYIDNDDVELDVPGCALYGNGQLITNGDASPSTSDHTDFGSNITTYVDRTFTISNIGDASLDLDGFPYVTFSSNPSGKFSVLTQPSTDPIGVGNSTTFVLRCAPAEPGEVTATVSISNNSEADDYTFDIKGAGDASLPVDLSSFSARSEGGSIILKWTTESETDNLGFILERTVETQDLASLQWQTIASYQFHNELQGQGNTSNQTEYIFTDQTVESGKEYTYRLSDVSTRGEITVYASLSVKMDALPETTEMENAYPNPFNPQTFIAYQLAEDSQVEIFVFDMLGRQVKSLYNGQQFAGSYHVYWNAADETGNKAPSGVYIIQMKTEQTRQIQKVMLMK